MPENQLLTFRLERSQCEGRGFDPSRNPVNEARQFHKLRAATANARVPSLGVNRLACRRKRTAGDGPLAAAARAPSGYKIFPGFRMPLGSIAALIVRMSAISSGLREKRRNLRFKEPIPCSAETEPRCWEAIA